MRIKNVIEYQKLEHLFGFTRQTWSKWKKEERPIVRLLEDNFENEEIEEFLLTGKIQKYELIKDFSKEQIENLLSNNKRNQIENQIAQKIQEIEELKKQL